MANLNKLGLNERQQVFLVVAFYMASILFVLIVAQFIFFLCCTLEKVFFCILSGIDMLIWQLESFFLLYN